MCIMSQRASPGFVFEDKCVCVCGGMTWKEIILRTLGWLSNRWFMNNKQQFPSRGNPISLSCNYMKAPSARRQRHGGKRAEERKEEGRQWLPIHRRGERVMVSCRWPTLCGNWFLVCGSAWQDARRQEPSSAGRIPAVARERRQPGRRVLLDWFYMGPSSGLVHLYPVLELAMDTPMLGCSLSVYLLTSQGMRLGEGGRRRKSQVTFFGI